MAERRSRRRPGENRERLLDAGTRVFARYGYHGASTSAIAALADVPQPHVYANFRSKSELFISSLEIACQEALGAVSVRSTIEINPGDAADNVAPVTSTELKPRDGFADLSQERAALIVQAIAAAQNPELAPRASVLLKYLRDRIGDAALSAIYVRALAVLLP